MSAQTAASPLGKTESLVAPGLHSPPDSTTKHDDSDSELSELDDALDEEPNNFMNIKSENLTTTHSLGIDQATSAISPTAAAPSEPAAVDTKIETIEDVVIPATQSAEIEMENTANEIVEEDIVEPDEFDGGVPVFRPTDKDFEEPFESYVSLID